MTLSCVCSAGLYAVYVSMQPVQDPSHTAQLDNHEHNADDCPAGLGSGLFFLGYSLSMVPSQLILMRVGAPRWLATIVTGWGLTAMSFSVMSSK
jgi:hypothetical protein